MTAEHDQPSPLESSQSTDKKDPFLHLCLASYGILDGLTGRSKCTRCGSSRKFFCYTCNKPVTELEGKLPSVKLPLKVDIIKHPKEVDGKSTAIHAALLAPCDVTIYLYPDMPEFTDKSKVLLVFPNENASLISDLFTSNESTNGHIADASSEPSKKRQCLPTPSREELFERVLFIDSTWSQTKKMITDDRLRDMKCVKLSGYKTHFWRNQDKSDVYLATIEAIYYFLCEYRRAVFPSRAYSGEYDNLMYFFVYMYRMVAKSKAESVEDAT